MNWSGNQNVLIASLLMNYHLISQLLGQELRRLLCIVVKDGHKGDFLNQYAPFPQVEVIGEIMSPVKLISKLTSIGHCPIFILPTIWNAKTIEIITSAVVNGCVDGKRIWGLPVLVTDSILPQRYDGRNCFIITIEEYAASWNSKMVIPDEKSLELVISKFEEVCQEDDTDTERALLAAACMLYPILSEIGRETDVDNYIVMARTLSLQSENYDNSAELSELFLHRLYVWGEKNTPMTFRLPYLKADDIAQKDTAVFFNDDYVFISSLLLKKIVAPFREAFSSVVLKTALQESGILCTDKDTHSTKMLYETTDGKTGRVRMFKFKREELCLNGEIPWIEMLGGIE